MSKVILKPFACPACGNGTMVTVEIEEDAIKNAKRLPAMITTTCKKEHSLVIFVDGRYHVRDIEVAVQTAVDTKDATDKAGEWFSSL